MNENDGDDARTEKTRETTDGGDQGSTKASAKASTKRASTKRASTGKTTAKATAGANGTASTGTRKKTTTRKTTAKTATKATAKSETVAEGEAVVTKPATRGSRSRRKAPASEAPVTATAPAPKPVLPDVLSADVLVIGGGLVGGTLACGLAQHGITVLVAEREDPAGWMSNAYDGRASAVALGGQKVLEVLGLWPHMADACQPINDIRIADADAPLFMHYHRHEAGHEPMGYMAENLVTRRAIQARLAALEYARLLAPVTVTGVTRDAHGAEACLKDGRRLRARLVVAADGRASPTRVAAGLSTVGWDYDQAAIVLTVEHEVPHNGVAIEHFLPGGPFATLPLTGNRSSIVWSERRDWVPALMALPEDRFKAEFMTRFGDHFGDARFVGPRFSYPLSLQFAQRYTAQRLALVGDAAHAMHPVAGQGMNYGLRDVAVLVEELVKAHRLGLDVGAPATLARYERLRRADNLLMLAATDGIVRLFSNDIGPLRLARTAGLAAVDRMGPLKRMFMRHAMGTFGIVGGVPRLMQGRAL